MFVDFGRDIDFVSIHIAFLQLLKRLLNLKPQDNFIPFLILACGLVAVLNFLEPFNRVATVMKNLNLQTIVSSFHKEPILFALQLFQHQQTLDTS